MPLQTIEPRRLYRQIAGQLRGLMDSGEFPGGSRLPPERDLAAQLGVSRPSVREALIALEVEGRVEVRMGSGIWVMDARAPGRAAAAQASAASKRSTPASARTGAGLGEGPLETIRARALIEAELAAEAARRGTPALCRQLRAALAAMRRDSAAGRAPTDGDRRFHLLIAEASENAVLQRIVAELFDERHNPLFATLGGHFETAASWALALDEHQAVIDAIAAGSAARARAAMRRHLSNSHARFTAAWATE